MRTNGPFHCEIDISPKHVLIKLLIVFLQN